jgi:hypothetical protein
MILNAEKTHAIKFQQIVMVPFGDMKIHYFHYEEFWVDFKNYSNIDLGHHYENSF